MSNVVFNTHSFVKRLTEVGMPTEQAEVLAESYATLIDEKLATKRDLKELALATKRDLGGAGTCHQAGFEGVGITPQTRPHPAARLHDGSRRRSCRSPDEGAVAHPPPKN